MLKETIKYTDYNNVEREEDFYFNLTQTEAAKMELSTEGGIVAKAERMVAQKDGGAIMQFIEDVVLMAYGEKSPDGRRFEKSVEKSIAFSQTPAYDKLFMRLCTNPDAMAAFVNGIVPDVPSTPAKQ